MNRYWAREKELVRMGMGTRDWTPEQQRELLDKGSISGIDRHHMMSVTAHPKQADNPDNIQPLTEPEHLKAHSEDYRNPTNGKYDPATGTTKEFTDGKIEAPEIIMLSDPIMLEEDVSSISASGEMADYSEKVDAIVTEYKSNLRKGKGSQTDPEKLAELDRQMDEKAAAAKGNYSSYLAEKYGLEEYNNTGNYNADRQFMFGETSQAGETGSNDSKGGGTVNNNSDESSNNSGGNSSNEGGNNGGNNGGSNDDGMEM